MGRGGSPLGSGAGASADQLAVRRHNLALVLSHLRAVGPRSRAKVAAETGLNKATVSSLVAELVERGLVAEGETERGAVGRPSQQINLDGTNFFTVGAEINVDYLAALAMNVRGEVVAEQRIAVDAARLGVTAVLRGHDGERQRHKAFERKEAGGDHGGGKPPAQEAGEIRRVHAVRHDAGEERPGVAVRHHPVGRVRIERDVTAAA